MSRRGYLRTPRPGVLAFGDRAVLVDGDVGDLGAVPDDRPAGLERGGLVGGQLDLADAAVDRHAKDVRGGHAVGGMRRP